MRRLEGIDTQWAPSLRDPNNWLPVDANAVPAHYRKSFEQRRRALELYLSTTVPIREVCRRSGVSRSALHRLVVRAFTARADGLPTGYLACVPRRNIAGYRRTERSARGKAGLFKQFLDDHPEIHQKLDRWVLGKEKIGETTLRGRVYKQLWEAFRSLCIEHQIDPETDYPFINRDGGREAIRIYARRLRTGDFDAEVRVVHGDDAARLITSSTPARSGRSPTRTYERVELDGHRLDALLTVRVRDRVGDEIERPMSRIWLLVLIDARSRAVLGYALSLRENYSMDDVLQCIGSAISPWSARELPADCAIAYHPGAGLPSGIVEGCEGRAFDSIFLDNALSHRSVWLQERLIEAGALEVVSNRPASPRSNAVVERFFGTFEELTTHRWPNTTGTGPADPRRRNPVAEAKRLRIGVNELELIADVAIANYNATSHTALSGRSPLEFIRYRVQTGRELVRHVPPPSLTRIGIFERQIAVTIRADPSQGHRPYVKYLHVRYSGPCLHNALERRGQKATLRVDIRDIRGGWLFSGPDCLGRVEAEPAWLERPHTAQLRRMVFAAIREGKLVADSRRPISDFIAQLAEKAKRSRTAATRLERVRRETARVPSAVVPGDDPSEHADDRLLSRIGHTDRIRLRTTVVR